MVGSATPGTHMDDHYDFDAVVIGAGFAGLYALHKFRDDLNMRVRVFEAGDGVGGTWYWNRYPGARCDSESYYYCYSFSPELAARVEVVGSVPGAARDRAVPRTTWPIASISDATSSSPPA